MADTPPLSENLQSLLFNIKQGVDHWRSAIKAGGVITVTADSWMPQMMGDYRRSSKLVQSMGNLTVGDLEEIAEHLGCVWAQNPAKRLYYFIPKELIGEQP